MATSCEELTHCKRLWCWEGLGAGGEGDDRGWDGWMASLTWWTQVWVNSGSWWWTGRRNVLRFMGSQIVRHDWATELNWTEWCNVKYLFKCLFAIFIYSLAKCLLRFWNHILIRLLVFLSIICTFWITVLCWMCLWQVFTPSLWHIFPSHWHCLTQNRSFKF